MKLLIVFISIFFDVLLCNMFKFSTYNISYFFPMLTITSIVYISNFYTNQNRKNYYMITLLCAIIYDTLTINNLLITLTLFETVAFLNIKLKKKFNNNLFNNILRLILSIFIYDLLFIFLLFIVKYQNINFGLLLYKFSHSLILNIVYFSIMFLVLKKRKA